MIGPISTPVSNHQGMEVSGPGKKAASVGHLAKAAVTAAREAGADVPKNAQGMAASAIARGIDPASLFAARVDEVSAPDETGNVDVVPESGGSEGADGSIPSDPPAIVPVSEEPDAAMLVNNPVADGDEAGGTPMSEPSDFGAVVQPTAPDLSEAVEVVDPLETALAILSGGSEERENVT